MPKAETRRALVERLEILARERPAEYRFRVTALTLVGLCYRALVWFALLSVPIVLTFAFYPATWAIGLVTLLVVVFGLLGFRPEPIKGQRVYPTDAPELYRELEALRAKTQAPRVDELILTDEFNAGAALIPRLGVFGWHKQVLILGIPLMSALSRDQLLAVIGHELGHFSKAHGRLGHWIYRTRHEWEKMGLHFSGETAGLGGAVNQFRRAFVPYFTAYSFVLARRNEYEADADAALACDPATAAAALASVHAYGEFIERGFWPGLWRSALHSPDAPPDVYARLADAARAADPQELEALKRKALRRASDLVDTHPCLTERLRALGTSDTVVSPANVCAGRSLLGENWNRVLAEASEQWRKDASRQWRDHHQLLQEQARRLAELRAAPDSVAVRMEIARIMHSLEGPQTALEHWKALRAAAPDDVRIAFQWVRALARMQDSTAFALMDDLASRHPGYAVATAEIGKELALALGDSTGADRYASRLRAARKKEAAVAPKLAEAVRNGALESHQVPPHAIALLVRQLQADGTIAGAYLASVACPEAASFRGLFLLIRIDPQAMSRAAGDPDEIANRCHTLLQPILEPNEFSWVRNFYTTEAVSDKIAAALSALPSSRLYGNLDSPEGVRIDPRNLS